MLDLVGEALSSHLMRAPTVMLCLVNREGSCTPTTILTSMRVFDERSPCIPGFENN